MKQIVQGAHSGKEKSVKEHEGKMKSKASDGKERQEEETQRDVESCWCSSGFDVLPNELVSDILRLHLEPKWRRICKSVCQRWHLLLMKKISSSSSSSSSSSLRSSRAWAANMAQSGHLQVLKWARSQGCPWDRYTCARAAIGGHLEVLQWARSQGCPWDSRTCTYAARGGHLQVLKWSIEQGCPWDKRRCIDAALGAFLKNLRRCPGSLDQNTRHALEGQMEILLWALE